jgi:hypothetical protein
MKIYGLLFSCLDYTAFRREGQMPCWFISMHICGNGSPDPFPEVFNFIGMLLVWFIHGLRRRIIKDLAINGDLFGIKLLRNGSGEPLPQKYLDKVSTF